MVPPPGEARPDTDFIFDLAMRLGLGEHFWQGEIDAAYRQQLAASGVTLESCGPSRGGIRVALTPRHKSMPKSISRGARAGFPRRHAR